MSTKGMILAAMLFAGQICLGQAKIDAPAPDFSVKDAAGKVHSLKDYKGQWVVLEWYNKDCPFVKKHYSSNNMQKLQAEFKLKGVKWLTVISSKKGSQGYMESDDALKNMKDTKSEATALLLDTTGAMGKAYDAKVTPHMFVINPAGNLVYAGAIDDNDSSDAAVIKTSKNYVKAALDEGLTGKYLSTKTSKAYGCSIKY